jgi:methyl-accepting chemotaxis protein
MSILYKLLAAFSSVVLLAAGLATYGIEVVSVSNSLLVRLYDGPLMAVSHARSAQLNFTEARAGIEKAMILREGADFAAIEKSMQQFASDMTVVRERMANAGSFSQGIEKVLPLAEDWHKASMSYLKPPAGGLTELPLRQVLIAKGNEVASAIDLVVENASAYGFDFRSESETSAASSKINLMVLAIVASVVGSILGFGMAYSFTRPIRQAMSLSEEIASGNLRTQIATKRRDELGRLLVSLDKTRLALHEMNETKERDRAQQLAILRAQIAEEQQKTVEVQDNAAKDQAKRAEELSQVLQELGVGLSRLAEGDLTVQLSDGVTESYKQIKDDFNTSIGRLHEIVGAIVVATREVANASNEISTSTTDLSQRTEEQAASLEQTSQSMEEISTAVKKNAENAQVANQSATRTQEVANRSGEIVAEAVGAMAKIEQSSCKISDIIGVIDEIARQTNLLALNAAVEAARAGESGRGFAVVASEVRSLAQRSSQAAKDIKDLINKSNGQVKDGVDLVNRAGTSLTEIVASIKNMAEIVSNIANASADQATGLEQINKALTQMDEVTQQNSALVEENAATAKMLEEQANAMDEHVAFFKLDEALDAERTPRPASAPMQRAPAMAARPQAAAPKRQPVPQVKRTAVAGRAGGPVGRMQAGLATAFKQDPDWKEF